MDWRGLGGGEGSLPGSRNNLCKGQEAGGPGLSRKQRRQGGCSADEEKEQACRLKGELQAHVQSMDTTERLRIYWKVSAGF